MKQDIKVKIFSAAFSGIFYFVVIAYAFTLIQHLNPVKMTSRTASVICYYDIPAVKAVPVAAKAAVEPVLPRTDAPFIPLIPPRMIAGQPPLYPFAALERGIEGTVVLSIYVNESGKSGNIIVKASSGAKELDDSAISAAYKWTFNPAVNNFQVIASWFEVPVSFRIR
jgi:TonB family protein